MDLLVWKWTRDPPEFDILEHDGSYARIKNKVNGLEYSCHASGDGDFCNHKIEFIKEC